ncbi:MAG: response regulator [Elusimicrobia bacterium]|jgi:DNA-binding response OmpR family regulator|nr:response regulator [Elusimicrobiota bacterium]
MTDPDEKKDVVVLVVEDDEAISEFLSLTLEQEGYEVCVAPDGEKGLEMIRSRKPVAVLLDLMLPGLDGLSILKYMQEDQATASIPVAVVSAYADAGDTRRVLDSSPNVKKVFVKPVLTEDLLKSVKKMIDGK